MKQVLPLILIVAMAFSSGCAKNEPTAIRIGDVQFSPSEFERAFKNSGFVSKGEKGRKLFLENFVSTRLILKEAGDRGLDKNSDFLEEVQSYWEQGLIKLMLTEKDKELARDLKVTASEVQDYYHKNKDTDFAGQKFEDVAEEIRWILAQEKQQAAMSAWFNDLKIRTNIEIDRQLLGIPE